jgi:hypothetical protein
VYKVMPVKGVTFRKQVKVRQVVLLSIGTRPIAAAKLPGRQPQVSHDIESSIVLVRPCCRAC